MTHCDFTARAARDEMRHIIGSIEPDVIIGSDRDQNRMSAERRTRNHIKFLCELYEAQVARGRYFVHELTSEVNSRMKCVAKVMAMARNKNGSGGSVHVRVGRVRQWRTSVCQRRRVDDHQCETSWSAVAEQMPEHASSRSRSTADNPTFEKRERHGIMSSPSCWKQWRKR